MSDTAVELRSAVEEHLRHGRLTRAWIELEKLWAMQPQMSTAQFVLSCLNQAGRAVQTGCRKLAILRSFTVEPLIPLLRAECLLRGKIDLDVRVGGFNTYAQEILSRDSFLLQFGPEAVILAVQTRDLVPELWERYADLSGAEEREVIDGALRNLECWILRFRSISDASLVVHTLDEPDPPQQGILGCLQDRNQSHAVREINDGIRRISRTVSGVYPFDYHALVARWGRREWYDERKWLLARMPIAASHLPHLAQEWARYLLAVFGKTAKVVVTDLDNTLWSGVVGEDGMEGIRMDREYPGAFYRGVQRAFMDLRQRGFLLAIASKNNEADALQVLENHPDMMLRPVHFASIRCNWAGKAQNLREIATELNVGTDSLVFVDDNPVERDQVRRELPEVAVIELPPQSEGYERAIREFPLFERLTLSNEDLERGRYYAEQKQREQWKNQMESLEDFYCGLQQEAEIRYVSPETIGRVAQLTQKTNQFNLTTRRYSEAEIAALASSGETAVYEVRLRDRFGDNGIIGVCITKAKGRACEIDTLLLSCRVIGRTVETALLSFLVKQSQELGIDTLQGWFMPTKKNLPAQEFYPSHGFQKVTERDGGALWALDLTTNSIECPKWLSLTCQMEDSTRETTCAS